MGDVSEYKDKWRSMRENDRKERRESAAVYEERGLLWINALPSELNLLLAERKSTRRVGEKVTARRHSDEWQ